MHSITIDQFTVWLHGDFTGAVEIQAPIDDMPVSSMAPTDYHGAMHSVQIPFSIILELAGRYMQQQDIARIEDKSGIEYVESSLLMLDPPEDPLSADDPSDVRIERFACAYPGCRDTSLHAHPSL